MIPTPLNMLWNENSIKLFNPKYAIVSHLEVKAHLHISTYCTFNQQRMQVTTHNLIEGIGKACIQPSVTIYSSVQGRFIMELLTKL